MGKWTSLSDVEAINICIQKHTDSEVRQIFGLSQRQLDSLKQRHQLTRNWWLFFPSMKGEEWKRIKSSNTAVSNMGRFRRTDTGKIVTPWEGSKGKYLYIEIKYGDNLKTKLAHRMVALAFVANPNPKSKTEVNHKDGDKRNILPSNLEWCTPQENVQHAHDTGLIQPKIGLDHHNSVLTLDQVITIRRRGDKVSFRQLAKELGVSKNTVSRCYYKLSYTDL